jgi:ssDNA-binding Zn-finger/Zn-ribbon topoisomerase 1
MKPENVECPDCGGPMTSRKNSTTGQRFWGCNGYPKCRGTLNTDGEARKPWTEEGEQETRLPSDRQRSNDRQRWRQT